MEDKGEVESSESGADTDFWRLEAVVFTDKYSSL